MTVPPPRHPGPRARSLRGPLGPASARKARAARGAARRKGKRRPLRRRGGRRDRALREAGYEACFVYGVFVRGHGQGAAAHCWTWLPEARLIVDVTAMQFNERRRPFAASTSRARRPSFPPLGRAPDGGRSFVAIGVCRAAHGREGRARHAAPAPPRRPSRARVGRGAPGHVPRRRWWTERWLLTFGGLSDRALPDIHRELAATSAERSP